MLKKAICILLSIYMMLCTAACGGADPSSSDVSSSEPSASSEDTTSADSSITVSTGKVTQSAITNDTGAIKGDGGESEQSGVVSVWTAPEQYVIVIPSADSGLKKYAVKIQQYFSDLYHVTLPVVTDKTAETETEILVGKTNRSESNKAIATGKYQVSVSGKKLVFDGGHSAMIDAAVQRFLSLKPTSDSQAVFSGSTDFKATALSGYEYVWGDEFEGAEVDFTKWTFKAKMSGTETGMLSSDRDVIDIGSGKLQLRAIQYENRAYPKVRFKMPISVVTQYNMMFTYGYCEIKAKMPFFKGAWPSFWTQSTTGIGDRKCTDYFVEVDILEVFGSDEGKVVSNIHKWYTNDTHSQWSAKKTVWTAPNAATIDDEYHVFGYQWTPKEISMYVDGKKIMTYDITKSYDKLSADMSGFHDPQFIIFNNHLFLEDSSYKPNTITGNEKLLPSEYFIEYFRLYQKKGEGKLWTDQKVYTEFTNR